MFRRHPILTVITFVYLGVVGWITLSPQTDPTDFNSLVFRFLEFFSRHEVTQWLTYQRLEFLANVAMFVPIGVFFLLLFGRFWWFASVIAGGLLTGAIEFAQRFIPGRVSDVSDLIANTGGAAVGVLLALIITTPAAIRVRRERRAAERSRAAVISTGTPTEPLTIQRA
jgi:glycopeptide antibiotics resistance protein